MMEIYTVEAFDGDGYELVLCTTIKKDVDSLSPVDYDTTILVVKTWKNGDVIHTYRKEVLMHWE